MQQIVKISISLLAAVFSLCACAKKVKQKEDEIYSRHLQAHIKLTVISTPMPDEKSDMNLLLLNDGQDTDKWKIKETLADLYKNNQIEPVLVVAIHADKRNDEYGVAGYPDFQNRGSRADKYADFIDNELYAFIKKKAGVRKFKSVVIAGASMGGLSAFDIAWNHADKIDKVGVFSGSFWWRDKDAAATGYSDEQNRIMYNYIKSSRKRPHLKYWFYAGAKEENGDRDKDGIIDVIDDTKDLVELIKSKNVCPPADIAYTEAADGVHEYSSWSKALPGFLLWAFGK
ncbi:MAG: alpha/beta hydrolase-fold protein [Ferruginibacter sp.]